MSRNKLKGKEKEKVQESTISTPVSTTDKPKMLNTITLDDYDLESSSDNFNTPIVKRPKWVNHPYLLFIALAQILLLRSQLQVLLKNKPNFTQA